MGKKEKHIDKIPSNAKAVLKSAKIIVVKNQHMKKNNLNKKTFLKHYHSYDFLQMSMIVRPYIIKKYNINITILELLLYLYPYNYFTRPDYMLLIRPFSVLTIDNLIDKGLARLAVDVPGKNKKIYQLSTIAKNIVTNYYETLAGAKKIPINYKNPFMTAEANRSDKIRLKLIKNLQNLPVPDTRKLYFEESNPDDKS